MMSTEEFMRFRAEFDKECENMLVMKGADYATKNDRFKNLKEDGEDIGLTPLQTWALYIQKHLRAIFAYVANGKVESEPIRGRFLDARNYLDLGIGLIEEMKN